jgi:hypothetical protein
LSVVTTTLQAKVRESVVVMSKRMKTKPALGHRNKSVAGDDSAVEDDVWCWAVIFTAAALTGLCVAILFSIGTL